MWMCVGAFLFPPLLAETGLAEGLGGVGGEKVEILLHPAAGAMDQGQDGRPPLAPRLLALEILLVAVPADEELLLRGELEGLAAAVADLGPQAAGGLDLPLLDLDGSRGGGVGCVGGLGASGVHSARQDRRQRIHLSRPRKSRRGLNSLPSWWHVPGARAPARPPGGPAPGGGAGGDLDGERPSRGAGAHGQPLAPPRPGGGGGHYRGPRSGKIHPLKNHHGTRTRR